MHKAKISFIKAERPESNVFFPLHFEDCFLMKVCTPPPPLPRHLCQQLPSLSVHESKTVGYKLDCS